LYAGVAQPGQRR